MIVCVIVHDSTSYGVSMSLGTAALRACSPRRLRGGREITVEWDTVSTFNERISSQKKQTLDISARWGFPNVINPSDLSAFAPTLQDASVIVRVSFPVDYLHVELPRQLCCFKVETRQAEATLHTDGTFQVGLLPTGGAGRSDVPGVIIKARVQDSAANRHEAT